MAIGKSKDWQALQTTDLIGSKYVLSVTGEVEMSASNLYPVLTKAHPQGINPAILLLRLGERQEGDIGNDVQTWRTATFSAEIESGTFDQVDIQGHAVVDVQIILS